MAFITLDFETPYSTGKVNPEKYSLTDMTYEEYIFDPRFWVYGFSIKFDNQPTVWYDFKRHDLKQVLEELFYPGNDHTLLCHNTMFDAAILCWYYGLQAQTYYCTMMMSHGLWRYESASLAKLCERLWPNDKKMRKGKELAVADGLFHPDEFTDEILGYIGHYCIGDDDLTFAAFAKMYPHFPGEELDVIDDTIKLFAHRPLVLDRELVINYQKEINQERQRIISESKVDKDILASSDKFVAYLKAHHDIEIKKVKSPTVKNPNNMKYPLAKNDLSFMKLRNERPDLEHIWAGRVCAASNQEHTRCNRFLAHGRICPANPEGNIAIPLKYCGAGTTRFSGTNSINMQNLGRKSKLRNAIKAPEGHTLLIADLSNIEGRMNAYHANADWKLEAYAANVDFYNDLATDVFGYTVDRKNNPEHEQEGALGKTGELGLGYGMGPPKFLTTCHEGPMGAPPMPWVTPELSERTVSTWRNKNIEIVTSWRIADEMLERMAGHMDKPIAWNTVEIHHQGIRLPNGLFMQYPRLRYDKSVFKNDDGSDRWTWQFWNGKFWKDLWGGVIIENIIQGISRVVMTQAQLRIKHRLQQHGVQLVMTIHDELVFICPIPLVNEAKAIVREELTRTPNWCDQRLVLDCDLKVSPFYIKG